MAPPTSLSPLDPTRAPEGGEVLAIQSGWRLAVREFVRNRLAVVGVAILLFFVVFCFLGPLFYHGDTLQPTSSTPKTPRAPGTRSAPTPRVSTSWPSS